MKERSILMSAPMVRALLEGRKTQLRRVVLHKGQQPPEWATWVNHLTQLTMKHEWVNSNIFQWSEEQTSGQPLKTLRRWPVGEVKVSRKYSTEMNYAIPCPYGVPGDRLWVRHGFKLYQPPPASPYNWHIWDEFTRTARWISGAAVVECEPLTGEGSRYVSKPSIHMPRWASRLTLEIVKVRVERVQDISEEDAMAEGTQEPSLRELGGELKQAAWSERQVFQRLWDSTYAKRGYGFDANPWVWVVEFQRVIQ